MPYEAKVKDNVVPKTVRFAGVHEFTRIKWLPLPDDKLELARNNPYLTIREAQAQAEPEQAEETIPTGSAEGFLHPDDLTKIKGVGKATADILAQEYPTFAALANADSNALKALIDNRLGSRLDAIDLIEQARELQ